MNKKKYHVEDLLNRGKSITFPISGWSMYPFIDDGDLITVQPCSRKKLHVNDVVLYRRINGPLVLHRIVKINENGIYLCGDQQSIIEGPIHPEQIYGVMIEITHRGKTICVTNSFYIVKSFVWRILLPGRDSIKKIKQAIKKG